MQVELAEERLVLLADRFTLDHAEGRAWAKRADAFGAAARIGGLINRAASDDYECVYRERRLQPFWRIHSHRVAVYERTRSYAIPVAPEVQAVALAGEWRPAEHGTVSVEGVESCREDVERDTLFDGLSGTECPALASYLPFAGGPVGAEQLADLARAGTVVVPATVKASRVVRDVVSAAIGRIDADRILDERLTVDAVDLVYRPVYAFRYRHGGKFAVVEFDGLTGDIRPAGSTFEQYLGKVLDPRFLLDAGVEAVNLFVPGTQLVRIVVEHGVKRVVDQRKR